MWVTWMVPIIILVLRSFVFVLLQLFIIYMISLTNLYKKTFEKYSIHYWIIYSHFKFRFNKYHTISFVSFPKHSLPHVQSYFLFLFFINILVTICFQTFFWMFSFLSEIACWLSLINSMVIITSMIVHNSMVVISVGVV